MEMAKPKQIFLKSNNKITENYFKFLDQHVADVVLGKCDDFMEINLIAKKLLISHQYLTETVQKETGNHPCYFYDLKIIDKAKNMLSTTQLPIAEIARLLTYDPSNFSKFFKKFVGQTPLKYREQHTR